MKNCINHQNMEVIRCHSIYCRSGIFHELKFSRIFYFGTFHEVKDLRISIFLSSAIIIRIFYICEILHFANLSSSRDSRKLKPPEYYQSCSITFVYYKLSPFLLKVIYHPLYSINTFVTNKSKLPKDGAQLFPYMGWLAINALSV